MAKKKARRPVTSQREVIGGRWLPNLLIWGGVLLMLSGGVVAYPILQGFLAPADAASLEFSITLVPTLAVTAVPPQPTAIPQATQPSTPTLESLPTAITSTAPPPVLLPETELEVVEAIPTVTEESVEPEVTPEPTATPSPTPTPDPASLIPNRLVIPAINLDAPVAQVGWETNLVNGQPVSSWIVPNSYTAGWHVTSALPGSPGNTVLNGHHNVHGEVFRYLENLQPGDEITLYTGVTSHYYAVTERHILKEKGESEEVRLQNAQFILPTEDERLTLVTCWPYTNNTHRLIIVAVPMQPTATPTPIAR
jgi:LPXTG-site transpeptidase (sortase) family protein